VNCVQDAWTEQVVKRGWTSHTIPNALEPKANGVWAVIVALAVVVFLLDRYGARAPERTAAAA
jgi:hypothetical protein